MNNLTIENLKHIIKKTKNQELKQRAETELVRRLILIQGVTK